ncbi:MAG: type III-A CRISPR-associated protein Cas10/Csm1 [Acidobacteriota bacterium]|nr:type III-A CRISPR-associated protein Cas10/Csm1 [Acidobacteriota bacterium]
MGNIDNIPTPDMLDASCRVAFAALAHDLGKFAERAALRNDRLDAHVTLYCKWHERGGYHSHRHAAFTGLFMDEVEKSAPDLIRAETFPFAGRRDADRDITDSIINAAAMHHRPQTLLQWMIATADRLASGFEREEFDEYNDGDDTKPNETTGRNHYQARQLALFEQVRLEAQAPLRFDWRYLLKPLAPENLFPVKRDGYEPAENEPAQQEYKELWDGFLAALRNIPASHRKSWPLWLDHFDTLWQSYTQAIPSATAFGVRPEVSLYDHSKATAAFATALWRWHIAQDGLSGEDAVRRHETRADWGDEKFLLVQGDFFGIQDFIFSDDAETNKNAAKLLRGRSFMVSLFTELAALRVLEALELPSTSQIVNAAGKFLIVAPNTDDARERLQAVRGELNGWFLRHAFGQAGLGLAVKAASCNDFLAEKFAGLMTALFEDLEREKLTRFDLAATEAPHAVFNVAYPHGVCKYNNHLPADESGSAALSRDQIKIGESVASKDRLLVVRDDAELRANSVTVLETTVFGYRIGFTHDEDETGRFGELAASGRLPRCWDFSLPENLSDTLWHGYARRYINAYVPHFTRQDQQVGGKYQGIDGDDDENIQVGAPKTFGHIACEDRRLEKTADGVEKWVGQVALSTLKGDVDNLGQIFQKGLGRKSTFAKMAALSRQMNAFFAVWLPAFCKEKYPDVYTVFAGGDDFFMVGPWHRTQQLAADMAERFKAYVTENPEIHFSAGLVMTKPKHPVHALAERAEEALDAAKGYESGGRKAKNSVCLYNEVVPWKDWQQLAALEKEARRCATVYNLSTGYIYGLLQLVALAGRDTPESVMWHSRFAYRTRRYVVDKLDKDKRDAAQIELTKVFGENIGKLKGRFRIPLFNYFYSKR